MSNTKKYWRGIQGVLGLTALVLVLMACGTQVPTTVPQATIEIPGLRKPQPSVSVEQPALFPEPSERIETSAAPGMTGTPQLEAQVAGTYFTELDDLNTTSWRVGNIPYLRVTVATQYDADGYLDQLEATGTTAAQNYANTDYKLPATVAATTTVKLILAKPLVQTSNTLSLVLKRADTSAILGTQQVVLSSSNQIGSYSDVSLHQIQNLSFPTAGLAANQTLQLWLTDLQSGAKFFAGGIRITNGTTTTNIDDVDFTKKNAGVLVWRKSNLSDIKKLFVPQGETAEVPLHKLTPYLAAGGYVVNPLKAITSGQSITFNGTFAMPTTTTDKTIFAYLQNATTFAQIPNSGQNIVVSSVAKRISFTVTKPSSVTGNVELVIGGIPFGQTLYLGNFKEPSTPPPAAGTGLTGEYFDNIDFTGSSVKRVDGPINFNWGTGAPLAGIQPITYSVRWTGQITAPTTEEYTFFVTSSDGARLMVNGQVLVNNWTDHGSTVNTGKITLKANTKYDIRLETYRNAINSGVVKLEWGSASRARVVVPTSALISNGSDLQLAISIIAQNANVQSLGLQLSPLNALGYKSTFYSVFVQEPGTQNAVAAQLDLISKKIRLLWRYSVSASGTTITDLVTGKSVLLGDLASLTPQNGKLSDLQKDNLARLVAPLYLDSDTIIAADLQKLSGLSAKAAHPEIKCLACESQRVKLFKLTVLAGSYGLFELYTTALTGTVRNVWGLNTYIWSTNAISWYFYDLDQSAQSAINNAILDFNNCRALNCPPQLYGENAQPSLINTGINLGFSSSVLFLNKSTATSDLDYSATILADGNADSTFFYSVKIDSGGTGSLVPGGVGEIKISGKCRSTVGTINIEVIISSNDPVRNRVRVPIVVNCKAISLITSSGIYFDNYPLFNNYVYWGDNINGNPGPTRIGTTGFQTVDQAFTSFKQDATTTYGTNGRVLTFGLVAESAAFWRASVYELR